MLETGEAALFFGASVLLGLAPGPDNLFVLAQSALHGTRAGLIVTLGLCTGLLVHTSAVALGVAALVQTSAVVFTALKLAGAAYLLYLAWQAYRAAAAAASSEPGRAPPARSPGRLYRTGIIMNVTNPKVAVFFLAFLPQFADPARGPLTAQLLALGGLFIVATILVFSAVAVLAGSLGQWLAGSARVQRIMNVLAGTLFAGLALRLATAQR